MKVQLVFPSEDILHRSERFHFLFITFAPASRSSRRSVNSDKKILPGDRWLYFFTPVLRLSRLLHEKCSYGGMAVWKSEKRAIKKFWSAIQKGTKFAAYVPKLCNSRDMTKIWLNPAPSRWLMSFDRVYLQIFKCFHSFVCVPVSREKRDLQLSWRVQHWSVRWTGSPSISAQPSADGACPSAPRHRLQRPHPTRQPESWNRHRRPSPKQQPSHPS